ncbi:hypothetical protein RDI58_015634 [Solanum bulbocastanum]|uniref:Uncharacterized protein n=1 Tax=Solanum bulbocastanum TaxID=147425 RepID=A0AAN8TFT5_SOLBU
MARGISIRYDQCLSFG